MLIELFTLGAIALGLGKAKNHATGIGRIKRRIYVEIEAAQNKGVDLEQKFMELPNSQKISLEETGRNFGWKQSKRSTESGKTYAEAYFNSLKRAYNAISGIYGIGATPYTSHSVRNGNGHVILTWRDYAPAEEHVKAEAEYNIEEHEAELRKRRNKLRRSGYLKDMILEPASNLQEEEPANTNYVPLPMTDTQQSLFGVGILNGWTLEDDDYIKINKPNGCPIYVVRIWPGSGYFLPAYKVYACDPEDALEKTVAWLETNNPSMLKDSWYDEDVADGLSEEELDEIYQYVDATLLGAKKPHVVLNENLRIYKFPL